MTKVKTKWSAEDIKIIEETLKCKCPRKDYDSYVRFDDVSVDKIIHLLDLGIADPEEVQNDAPSIEEIVNFLKIHPEVKAGGYVIFPPRKDIRVSIELLKYDGEIDRDMAIDLANFSRTAQEFNLTKNSFRAWWD